MKQQQQILEQEDESYNATPICGANFTSEVVDASYYMDELKWNIGGRIYIANAD